MSRRTVLFVRHVQIHFNIIVVVIAIIIIIIIIIIIFFFFGPLAQSRRLEDIISK